MATFIPPFLWGPLIVILAFYLARHSGVMVTEGRFVYFHEHVRPGKYSVLEIPLGHLIAVKTASLTRGPGIEWNIIGRAFGAGDVELHWESAAGTRFWILDSIKNPKALANAGEAARTRLRPPLARVPRRAPVVSAWARQ